MANAGFEIMKTRLLLLALGLVVFWGGSLRTLADLEVSAGLTIGATSDFYAPLSADGSWVDVGSYGRCWRPAGVRSGWRPYCHGYWEWADCGWYWVPKKVPDGNRDGPQRFQSTPQSVPLDRKVPMERSLPQIPPERVVPLVRFRN